VTSSSGAPRFSVIVPTYNRAATIASTLEAVAAQTFVDHEVVVVDDGSTDDTATVVKDLDLIHVTYLWQPNAGVSAARNRGVEDARGEYVVFLDTGDVPRADWLASFDLMIRAFHCEVVSCGADFTRDGRIVRTVLPRRLGPGAGFVIGFFRAGCFAVRRDRFLAVGGFDPVLRFSEVSELGMRIGQELSGRTNAVTHIARSCVAIELPPGEGVGGRATSHAYTDEVRLETAEYILAKHADVMRRAPRLRQTYLRIAGVAAARIGDYGGARRRFLQAWRAQPRDVRELWRAAATAIPGLRSRLWPAIG
jgi:glycosyltransferase involved in cell wall biosynthesis